MLQLLQRWVKTLNSVYSFDSVTADERNKQWGSLYGELLKLKAERVLLLCDPLGTCLRQHAFTWGF